jgi:hypothetical protein
MKIRPVGAEFFHADSQEDDEVKGVFTQFCERLQEGYWLFCVSFSSQLSFEIFSLAININELCSNCGGNALCVKEKFPSVFLIFMQVFNKMYACEH